MNGECIYLVYLLAANLVSFVISYYMAAMIRLHARMWRYPEKQEIRELSLYMFTVLLSLQVIMTAYTDMATIAGAFYGFFAGWVLKPERRWIKDD